MEEKVMDKNVDDKRAAKVVYDKDGAHLHTLNNGFQWSGAAIYSLEVAKAAHDVLGRYIKEMERSND